jgi:hypothetical protein
MSSSLWGLGNVQHSFGEEVPVRVSLVGGTVTSYTVTGLSSLTVNQYADQDAVVLTPTSAIPGRRLHIVSNTATVITFTENVQTLGLANTDVLSIEQRGKRPAVYTQYCAIKDEVMLATPKHTVEQQNWSGAGKGLKPAVTTILKTDFASKIPLLFTDFRIPFLIFGDESCTGTNSGAGASTLSANTHIGELVVPLAARDGYANGDYIQIDVGALAEVRKVASGGGLTGAGSLTLDYPLRKAHLSGVACHETVKPYTHLPTFLSRGVYATWQAVYLQVVNVVFENHGLFVKSVEMKIKDGEQVKLVVEFEAMKDSVDGTAQTIQSVTLDTPFMYSSVSSGVTYNGATYGQVREITLKIARTTEAIRYDTDLYGLKPALFSTGEIRITINTVLDITNRDLLDLQRAGTPFTLSFSLVRTAVTDLITFSLTNVVIGDGPYPLPPNAATVKVNKQMTSEDITVTVVDVIPYYPMGVRT